MPGTWLSTAVFMAAVFHAAVGVAGSNTSLHLIYIGPWSGYWPGSFQMEPAIKMAFEHINGDPNVLPGWDLQRTVVDSGCEPGGGLKGLFDVLADKSKTFVGIAGPGCSSVSGPVSATAGLFNMVSLSPCSGAFHLSNTEQYPYFLRVIAPHASYVPAMIALADYFQWKRVAMITESTSGTIAGTMAQFRIAVAEAGLELTADEDLVTVQPADSPALQKCFDNLRWATARVIYAHAFEPLLRRIFCEALRRGMTGPEYVWIIPGWHPQGWYNREAGDLHDCTSDELKQATQGYLATDRTTDYEGYQPSGTLPNGWTGAEWKTEYTRRAGAKAGIFGSYAYDMVWTWAFVLHELLVKQGLSVDDMRSPGAADRTRDVMLATKFTGASGDIAFGPNGDRGGFPLIIGNMQDGVQKLVGVHLNGAWEQEPRSITWWYNLTAPPPGGVAMPVPGDGTASVCPVNSKVTRWGDNCEQVVPTPEFKHVYPSVGNTLHLAWHPSPSKEGLLLNYFVSGFVLDVDDGESVAAWLGRPLEIAPEETSTTLMLAPSESDTEGGGQGGFFLERNQVYWFEISALYAREHGVARAAVHTWAGKSKDVVDSASVACIAVENVTKTCGCGRQQFHVMGAPGITPRQWGCEACPKGARCAGRTWSSVTSLPGWYMMLSSCLGAHDGVSEATCSATPLLHRCAPWEPWDVGSADGGALPSPKARSICPGGMTTRRLVDFMRRPPLLTRIDGNGGSSLLTTQCQNGTFGVACKACKDGWNRKEGLSCEQCQDDAATAVGQMCAIALGLLIAIAAVMFAFLRCSRRSQLERSLLDFLDRVAAAGSVLDIQAEFAAMDQDGDGELGLDEFILFLDHQGVLSKTPADFNPADRRRQSHKNRRRSSIMQAAAAVLSGTHGDGADPQVSILFNKIDLDNNGAVSFHEFMTFAYHVKKGEAHTGGRVHSFALAVAGAVRSRKNKALLSVLLSYIQVLDSFPIQFPEMITSGTALEKRCGGEGAASTTAVVMENLRTVMSLVSGISADSAELTRCAFGPRYFPRLVALTMLPLCFIAILFFGARLLWSTSARHKGSALSSKIRVLGNNLNQLNFTFIFLTYPTTARIILLAFQCEDYSTGTPQHAGQDVAVQRWLSADTSISCDDDGNGEDVHGAILVYATTMVIVFIIGTPLFVFVQLRMYLHPIDRIYISDEDGRHTVTELAQDRLGGVVKKYTPQTWYYESVEMARKLFLGAAIGLFYSSIPSLGDKSAERRLVLGITTCLAAILAFVIIQPYADAASTRLQVLVHVSFLASFVQGLVHAENTEHFAECTYDGMHRGLQWLPAVYFVLEFFEIPWHLWNLCIWCGKERRRRCHRLAREQTTKASSTLHDRLLSTPSYERDMTRCRGGTEGRRSRCMALHHECDQLSRTVSRTVRSRWRAVDKCLRRDPQVPCSDALRQAIDRATEGVERLRAELRDANMSLNAATGGENDRQRRNNAPNEPGLNHVPVWAGDPELPPQAKERFSWEQIIGMEHAAVSAARGLEEIDAALIGCAKARGEKTQTPKTEGHSRSSSFFSSAAGSVQAMYAKRGSAERMHAALLLHKVFRPPRVVETQMAMRRMAGLLVGTAAHDEDFVDKAVIKVLQECLSDSMAKEEGAAAALQASFLASPRTHWVYNPIKEDGKGLPVPVPEPAPRPLSHPRDGLQRPTQRKPVAAPPRGIATKDVELVGQGACSSASVRSRGSVRQSSTSESSTSEASTSEPSASDPTVSVASASQPSVSEPSATEPSARHQPTPAALVQAGRSPPNDDSI